MKQENIDNAVKSLLDAAREIDPQTASVHYWKLPPGPRTYFNVVQALLGDELEILKQLDKESVARIRKELGNEVGRIVREYENSGAVRHVVSSAVKNREYYELCPELEDQVRDRFGLRDVVVVDISRLEFPHGSPLGSSEAWNDYDDRVHELLGVWAGRILGTVVRPGDVLGVGGGRGPHYTAEHCAIPWSVRDRPKQIVSLTGNMAAHFWGKVGRVHGGSSTKTLDADVVCGKLFHELGSAKPPRFFGASITAKKKRLKLEDVTLAVIGIGALGGGHRLKRYDRKETDVPFDDVEKELGQLIRIANKADPIVDGQPPFLHWVGDVCNFLFVVNQLDRQNLPKAERSKLVKAVNAINECFVSPTSDELSRVCDRGAVIAVAGGPHKAAAIRHVVTQRRRAWITHLVTDLFTAQEILKGDEGAQVND